LQETDKKTLSKIAQAPAFDIERTSKGNRARVNYSIAMRLCRSLVRRNAGGRMNTARAINSCLLKRGAAFKQAIATVKQRGGSAASIII
jgi:hypothetical protein